MAPLACPALSAASLAAPSSACCVSLILARESSNQRSITSKMPGRASGGGSACSGASCATAVPTSSSASKMLARPLVKVVSFLSANMLPNMLQCPVMELHVFHCIAPKLAFWRGENEIVGRTETHSDKVNCHNDPRHHHDRGGVRIIGEP